MGGTVRVVRSAAVAAVAVVLAGAVGTTSAATAPGAARVELFSPEGTAKGVRQVTARFSAPMVALGDPRLPAPFAIDCAAPGAGRWADARNWVYDFDADLPAGLACRFRLTDGLRTAAGAPLTGRRSFAFDTGGPAVVASLPREGSEAVDEDQAFVLKLDAPATPASVAAHAWCSVEGVGERIPVDVLDGARRDAILANRAKIGWEWYWLLWKSGDSGVARVRSRTLEEQQAELAVVQCRRRLPPGAALKLVWGRGVATASGLATAQDQALAFRVRPAFTAQAQCQRTNARAGCIPGLPVTVQFSAPVPREHAAGIRLRGARGAEWQPRLPDAKQAPTVESVTFAGPFPEKTPLTVTLPAGLVDDAGRPLENAARFPLELRVDEYPPLAKFAATFGILEAAEGGVLPVTLRNVEPDLAARQLALPGKVLRIDGDAATVAGWLRRVEQAGAPEGEWIDAKDATPSELEAARARRPGDGEAVEPEQVWREQTGAASVFSGEATTSLSLPLPTGGRPAEVVGIPLGRPGFYVVELESRRLGQALLGRDRPRYVAAAALVTNLAVHLKWGRESSRVWVTRLDDGRPVAGAEVAVADFCSGATLWTGRTDAQGLAAIDASLGEPHGGDGCWPGGPTPRIASAKQGGDFAFAVSSWADGIAPYSFGLPTGSDSQADLYHTVLDRALFRAGETVSMKHLLRRHRMSGFAVAPGVPATRKVVIRHAGSGQSYDLEATFGADGVATQAWRIPTEAALGEYSVSIARTADGPMLESGRFQVQQFRLPSMRASVDGPARSLVRPRAVPLDLHVAYLSGGGAADLAVKLRTVVEPRPVRPADHDDYTFGGAPVVEGVVLGDDDGGLDFERDPAAEPPAKVRTLPLTLDAAGSARVTIDDLPALDGPAVLTAELEYPDANGELLSATGRVRLVPSALHVGVRPEGWAASTKQLRFRVVVLDLDSKPVANQPVDVRLYRSTAYSYRKRLVGGFYAYESSRETRRLDATCAGRTNAQGLVLCDVAPGVAGEVLVRAETRDAEGRVAGATTSMWVVGEDDWWFGGTAGDRMDLLPESKEYQPGETARFQVRMPFRRATALVTVEREGVLTSFVTTLDGRSPVVEVPVAAGYSPNVYVSVLAVRGRAGRREPVAPRGTPELTATVDLRRPAFRLGVAAIRVGWQPHRLDVRVAPEKPTYRVRERASVAVQVARADGSRLPAGTEVAIAAVDEALLDLAPNASWNLLEAMMGVRGTEVWTSTAQTQVVGKRHYGRKAVAHGGGGGRERDRGRELFDSLLLWQPRVLLDADGRANVVVPLNDSLTSFRIVAVAHGGAAAFGTGSATVATTQDLVLVSGLPPLVREGDRYAATFTVRNASARTVVASVEATVGADGAKLPPHRVELAPGRARDVAWTVDAPVGTNAVRWTVTAREIGGHDTAKGANGAGGASGASGTFDRITVTTPVRPAFPVRTYQATIAQLMPGTPLTVPAEAPAGSLPGRGGVEVTLRARLGDGLEGVRAFMGAYDYVCLEQQLSKAIALDDRRAFEAWTARLPAYMDRDGLLRYFPTDRLPGDDALTAYVLAIAHEAGWDLPEDSRQRMLDGLARFATGRVVRYSALPTADLTIRRLAAIEALARHGAATPAMLDPLTIEPRLWPTSAVLDWLGILDRLPGVKDADARRREALGVLRARLNFQGTTMGFSTERTDALWWLMISADSNANRLLLAVLERPEWREDVPRVVRGTLGRMRNGHWNTTVANAWGTLAFRRFSATFESQPVTGATGVSYGTASRRVTWPAPDGVAVVESPWQPGRATLAVAHAGGGRPWAIVRTTAALPLAKPLSSGYRIVRTVTPVERQRPNAWSRGDVLRVRLEIESQSDMAWVVVDDPVPAGATVLGSGLGGQSELATRGERREGQAWPAYEERRFDAFRAYYRYVPKGRFVVEYTLRLNNPGTFVLPATRVEAMYAPEMFGELPNAPLTVAPQP